MKTQLHEEQLRKLLMDYYTVTGQRIGIFDADYHIIMEYPQQHSPFCSLMRDHEEGRQRCQSCDYNGMLEAQRTGTTCIYRCHAGLIEVCAPILDDSGTIGYIMFGQLLYDHHTQEQWNTTLRQCAAIIPDIQTLSTAFQEIRKMAPDYLNATANILTACVGYIRLEQWMKIYRDGLWVQIQTYIQNNLTESFTLRDMANSCSVSIATLCKTAKANSGRTIGQLLLDGRLCLAKKVLTNSDHSISEIANMVGIGDYNYFSRIFRNETGMSPTQYRKEHRYR